MRNNTAPANRDCPVTVRLSRAELAQLRTAAVAMGVSLTALFRLGALEQARRLHLVVSR